MALLLVVVVVTRKETISREMVRHKCKASKVFKVMAIKVDTDYKGDSTPNQGLTTTEPDVVTTAAVVSDTVGSMMVVVVEIITSVGMVMLAPWLLVVFRAVATVSQPQNIVPAQQGTAQSGQGVVPPAPDFISLEGGSEQSGPTSSTNVAANAKVLCDYCELADHKYEVCPMLSAPKPKVIIFFGLFVKLATNVFKVCFLNNMELERLKVFGTFHVPNSSIKLSFEQVTPKVDPICLLPEIWVYMTWIPPKRKGDFLGLWGLGSLFGKTIKVDMPYTREHGVLRILIGCLDYTRIPDKLNVFVVDGFYELSFEVQIPEGDEEMEDAPSDINGPPKDDDQS
ncbi:hypothetical protein ACQ4PT_051360 [Festuca glaucescens]